MKRLLFFLFPISVFAQSGYVVYPAKSLYKDTVQFSKSIRYVPGAGAGKVLTSDATGRATWQTASGGGGTNPYFQNGLSNLNDSTGELGGALLHNTIIDFDPTDKYIAFGDLGGGAFLYYGNIAADGVIKLASTNHNTDIKAFDADDETYGMLDLNGSITNPTAPAVRLARTHEADYDFGYTAFDLFADSLRIANLYYFDVPLNQDLISLSVQYDYATPSASFIAAHIHTDLTTPNEFNGWRATPSKLCLYTNTTDPDNLANGNHFIMDIDGNLQATSYPNTRNDVATFTPDNFRYQGANGEDYVAPLSELQSPFFSMNGTSTVNVGAGVTAYTGLYATGGSSPFSVTESQMMYAVDFPLTVSRLKIVTSNAQPASGSLVITVRKNGAGTAVTVTIPAGSAAGTYSDLANSVSFAQDDTINYQIINNASATSAVMRVISMKLLPD